MFQDSADLPGSHSHGVSAEFMIHYHTERYHQGLGGRLIDPQTGVARLDGKIACRERLGGLLRSYSREAA